LCSILIIRSTYTHSSINQVNIIIILLSKSAKFRSMKLWLLKINGERIKKNIYIYYLMYAYLHKNKVSFMSIWFEEIAFNLLLFVKILNIFYEILIYKKLNTTSYIYFLSYIYNLLVYHSYLKSHFIKK